MWLFVYALSAPTKTLTPAQLTGTVDSPLGPIMKQAAWGMCFSPSVVVGKVVAFKYYRKKFTRPDGSLPSYKVYTSIRLDIERTVRGIYKPSVTVDVPGGVYNNLFIYENHGGPQPIIGQRYAFGYHTLDMGSHFSNWPDGQPIINSNFTLDSDMELPETTQLQAELDRACEKADWTR